jgi:TRAP-type transport system periplasmic protein
MRHVWMVAVLVLALVGVSFAPLPAQDKPIELRFSSWVATVHGHHTGVMVPWAKMVEEKSGGRLKITIYPGSTLGKAVDHYDMVKDGIADMGFTVPGYTPGRFPLITALELPGLFKTSRGGSLAVMSVFDKYFKSEFKDVKILWFWVHPPGHFHLAKKQVKVLEDLNGLKIRAATPMLTNMVKTLGAIPVSIPAPDTYTALERGTVDGTIFPWEAISSFKIAEVLKYHVASGLYVAPLFTLMNQKKYDSLPPDLRKVIDDLSGSLAPSTPASSGTRTSSSASRRSRRRAGSSTPCPPRNASAGPSSSSRSRRSG